VHFSLGQENPGIEMMCDIRNAAIFSITEPYPTAELTRPAVWPNIATNVATFVASR
jgi:hypothetical protein